MILQRESGRMSLSLLLQNFCSMRSWHNKSGALPEKADYQPSFFSRKSQLQVACQQPVEKQEIGTLH
jgi:hypothetical protein